MSVHPENSPEINELISFVESQKVVEVWCRGCQMPRVMNGVYAKYVSDMTISSCRFCRDKEVGENRY